jgi:hypothetical protein
MKKVSKRILNSLDKLKGELGKVYGECYYSEFIFTAEKIDEFLDLLTEVKYCLEDETNYKDKGKFEDEYQEFFEFSIYKSHRNGEDMRDLNSALYTYNKWAGPCSTRKITEKEFIARLNQMGLGVSSDGKLITPENYAKPRYPKC